MPSWNSGTRGVEWCEMKFKWSYRILTVWGIPIKVHISLALLLLMPGLWLVPPPVIGALVLILGIATSITLHELAHSYVAKKKGCRVQDIVLLPLGGVARMQIPNRPMDELLMAIAGPATSLALGLLILPLAVALQFLTVAGEGTWNDTVSLIWALGALNLAYVVFNLLPAFPMDGGRILRALLVKKLGRLRATFTASLIGKVLAVLFCLAGLVFFRTSPMLLVIGIFVFYGAHNEYRSVERQEKAKMFSGGFFQSNPMNPPSYTTSGSPDDEKPHAIVEPPPYEHGPGKKATVHELRDGRRR